MYRAQAAPQAKEGKKTRQPSLDALRAQIDSLDDALLDLVEQRIEAAKAVAALKSESGDGHLCLRPRREQQVIARLCRRAQATPKPLVELLWRELMAFSLQEQVHTCLVLQGPDRGLLERCARRRFGSAAPLRSAGTAGEALEAALEEQAVAVIALEDDSEWVERLDPALSVFDLLRDGDGAVVAAAIGRIPPEELPEPPVLPHPARESKR